MTGCEAMHVAVIHLYRNANSFDECSKWHFQLNLSEAIRV